MTDTSQADVVDAALRELLDLGALAGNARVDTEHLALKSRFMAAEAASAVLAATGIAAADIHSQRGGPATTPRVASRHAEASLFSFSLHRFGDAKRAPALRLAPEERTAAAGFYTAKDGRSVYLHSGFPHNTAGLLKLLHVPDDRGAVNRAVAGWDGQALEDAIAEAGLCGAMARPAAEWDACDAGRRLAERPVVDVIKVADSPPEPFQSPAERPLDGIRVLDLTRILAGPTWAMYGANALRIGAERLPSIPLFVADTGLGKRAAYLDLATEPDRNQLNGLIEHADVFWQGYRTGAMERLGFGVDEEVARRPGIIYVSINCYGHEGDWRTRPGWEQLAQTVTGITALRQRALTGGSYWVRASLSRTGMWIRNLGLREQLPGNESWSEEELLGLRDTFETDWGPMDYLRAPVSFDNGCFVGWRQPPVQLGKYPATF
jgi:crotonobetainyl-CoA:carnitine CoA-transferase CaiB-like acyl-CoA transferase